MIVTSVLVLCACSALAVPVGNSTNENTSEGANLLYCPSVDELKSTLCQSSGPYTEDQLPFPLCLILFKGESYTFSNGQHWKLVSVNSSLSDTTRLQFQTAYINEQGVFCAYKAKTSSIYIALEYVSSTILKPTVNTQWKGNVRGSLQPYDPSKFSTDTNYSCIPASNQIQACPFTAQ